MASVHFTTGRDKAALDAIEQYLKVRPLDADAWDMKGCLLLRAHANREAMAAIERACAISPGQRDPTSTTWEWCWSV